ncbi:unnamed protein product, partial [Oppiella nova]
MSKRKWDELYDTNDTSLRPDSSDARDDSDETIGDHNRRSDDTDYSQNECNDGIDSSGEEQIAHKMARNMAPNECTHSDDVCHSMQSQYDGADDEAVDSGFQCDSINSEISSSGISSSGNVDVLTSSDH